MKKIPRMKVTRVVIKVNKKVPKLRFREFSGEWQEMKLGDVAEVIDGDRGVNYPKQNEFFNSGYCLFLNAGNVTKSGFNFSNKLYITKEKDESMSKGKLNKKDIVLTTRGSVGNFAYYNTNVPIARIRINSGMVLLRVNEIISPEYLYKLSNSPKLTKQIKAVAFGSAQPQLTVKTIKKFNLAIPTLDEQEKIAGFLRVVDEKIEQLQAKKGLLEKYKKGVMQKIFSQEFRFKDENDKDYPDWKKKKLGDIFIGLKGTGLSLDKISNDGKNKCVLYGELYTKYPERIEKVFSYTDVKNGVLSKMNDLLLPCSTTTTGIDLANATSLNEAGVLLGGDISILRFKDAGSNTFYAYYLTHFMKNKLAAYGQGSTIVHMYYSHYKNMIIIEPCLEEQQKIADFLTTLDDKIKLEESRLVQAKKFKKALLQQMFV